MKGNYLNKKKYLAICNIWPFSKCLKVLEMKKEQIPQAYAILHQVDETINSYFKVILLCDQIHGNKPKGSLKKPYQWSH